VDITIITFNYDIALDFALSFRKIAYDYFLASDAPSTKLPLLKLHGSLNWAYCPHCKTVLPWDWSAIQEMYARLLADRMRELQPPDPEIPVASWLQKGVKHNCPQPSTSPLPLQPLIVPPTWNKGEQHGQIRPVWRKAARDLQEASVIVVCGYSLPETDYFFRYLFALGTMGRTRLKRFLVVDPNLKEVLPRYERLLGPLATQRFGTIKCNFSTFVHSAPNIIRVP
jgi:NAD-dependent SIR2 family protein deacetylase